MTGGDCVSFPGELRRLAASAGMPDADRARLLAIAAHLERLEAVESRVLELLRSVVHSDSVAKIDAALAELLAWSLGSGSLRHG